jgi:hypothetical protein
VPLTGNAALCVNAPWDLERKIPTFLTAHARQLPSDPEHAQRRHAPVPPVWA